MQKAEINFKKLLKMQQDEIILNIAEIEKAEIHLKIAENTEMRKAEINLKQLQKNKNGRSFYEFENTEIIKAEINLNVAEIIEIGKAEN
ncbi:hypothetical protein FVB03_26410 [Escherichia coli]|uniref:hypothetical protein n=1 Tax=Escherichia coli TaxID=562 RepID=UPI00128C83DD|nr:hypothetical protein [Escherichia coli]MPU87859.1 hypothetical protein [Escherichia coli]